MRAAWLACPPRTLTLTTLGTFQPDHGRLPEGRESGHELRGWPVLRPEGLGQGRHPDRQLHLSRQGDGCESSGCKLAATADSALARKVDVDGADSVKTKQMAADTAKLAAKTADGAADTVQHAREKTEHSLRKRLTKQQTKKLNVPHFMW